MYNREIVFLRGNTTYDFLDLGCKKGGSIEWCAKKYGGRGLGVDMNQAWVDIAKQKGLDVICADVLKLKFRRNSFRYIAMLDFLEHLESPDDAKKVLKNCKKWGTDFFFIHHPSFEDIEYLKAKGFKIDWTDGYNHTNPLTIADFKRIFKELGLKHYKISKKEKIADSSDPHILPLSAPHDTHLYNASLGPKKKVKFDKPVYGRIEFMVSLKGGVESLPA